MFGFVLQATEYYFGKDPDPYETRHPSRASPSCQLGSVLKTFFKKDVLVQDVFNNYLRENYFSRQGQVRGSMLDF